MPLYEYKCNNCGETFESLQRFSDEPLKVHPKCGGGPLQRLLSAPAFQFKGTGWYVTDYGRGGSSGNSKNGSSKPESPKADAKPSAPESAPASKS